MNDLNEVKEILVGIYGEEKADRAFDRILPLIEKFTRKESTKEGYFSQEDVVLITYGDTLLGNEGDARGLAAGGLTKKTPGA